MNDRYVFVYGTLRKGAINAIDQLTPAAEYVGTAQVRGTLYNFGSYPGLVLEQAAENEQGTKSQVIYGEVWKISQTLEQKLDAIEAQFPSQPDEFLRDYVTVAPASPNGLEQTFKCVIYTVNPKYVEQLPVIKTGDWLKPCSSAVRTPLFIEDSYHEQ
jgi:gamma-glutamylcyclotransferase (GGCT)/AIG2-like uncharacterized protein YtfP